MYDDRNRGSGQTTPVEVGDEIDVTIEAVGEKGDGIAKKKGFVLFIPNTKEGERVRIRVTKVLRKVGFAEKIGDAGAPAAGDDDASTPAEVAAPAEPDPEDSEDFGEEETTEETTEDLGMPEEETTETPAEESQEAPAEEPAEEEKAESTEDDEKSAEEKAEKPAEEEKAESTEDGEESAEEKAEEPAEESSEEEKKDE